MNKFYGFSNSDLIGLPSKSSSARGFSLFWRLRFLADEDWGNNSTVQMRIYGIKFYQGSLELPYSKFWTGDYFSVPDHCDCKINSNLGYKTYLTHYSVELQYARRNWVLEYSNNFRDWYFVHKKLVKDEYLDPGNFSNKVLKEYSVYG